MSFGISGVVGQSPKLRGCVRFGEHEVFNTRSMTYTVTRLKIMSENFERSLENLHLLEIEDSRRMRGVIHMRRVHDF